MAKTFKVGQSVRIVSMAIIAVGRVTAVRQRGFEVIYDVRLPNWQADGVHLDTHCGPGELETGHGRAVRCVCCFCR